MTTPIWADAYAGRPESYGHLSDKAIADKVRMLMRDDLEHEGIVVAARDRIARLARQLRDAQDTLARIALEYPEVAGPNTCPPAPHACPKCEIYHLLNEDIKTEKASHP